MTPRIPIPHEQIAVFCQNWKISEFSLFGSVLRDDFRPDSDVDVLVTFAEDAKWSLRSLVRMENELSEIFGRKVDLTEKLSVERSQNYIRKQHILSNTHHVYAAR
jgi:predicted nucleotidyltransferase